MKTLQPALSHLRLLFFRGSDDAFDGEKKTYLLLNIPTPCPPLGVFPVHHSAFLQAQVLGRKLEQDFGRDATALTMWLPVLAEKDEWSSG